MSNAAEPKLLEQLGLKDAKAIAPHYGLFFPDVTVMPSPGDISLASSILAAQTPEDLLSCLPLVSEALWQVNGKNTLIELGKKFGQATQEIVNERFAQGNYRREELKHYSSAMFYYGEEWYWGIDRLYHLEQRLQALGTDKNNTQSCLFERPKIELSQIKDNGSLTFEIYASLRSPYTAIVFDRAIKLAKDTGVKYVVRPLLPMVMRGVPATKEKGLYILFDTAREAREAGVPYGNVKDPIGQPARHGYALYQWACTFNKGTEFFSHFLSAAFANGINTNTRRGLRHVVEKTGLDWQHALTHLSDSAWQQVLEDNRTTMYDFGLWGVPSFRLLDQQGNEVLSLWGQDRLWLFAREIKRLLSN